MDKRQALTILINTSYLLEEEDKLLLLAHINDLSDEEVEAIGTFFAEEKKAAIENAQNIVNTSYQAAALLSE